MGCGSSTSAIRPIDTVPRQIIAVEENAKLQDPEPVNRKRNSSRKCSGCGDVIEGDTVCNSCKNRLNLAYDDVYDNDAKINDAKRNDVRRNNANIAGRSHLQQVNGTDNETRSSKKKSEENAAVVIQAAYRGYITRKETREIKWVSKMVEDMMQEALDTYYEERRKIQKMIEVITEKALNKYIEEKNEECIDEKTDNDDQSKIDNNIQSENNGL